MSAVHAPVMRPVPHRVASVRRETADTVTLSIAAGEAGFAFGPGQFNMLYAFAVGEVPISMSGDPSRGGEIVHTIKGVGAVSKALCGLRKGAVLGVRGPFGRPWPVHEIEGMDVVLVAGGLGLAPLRPVIYHLLAQRKHYGAVSVLIGARTPADLLYRQEIDRWRRRKDLRVRVTVDHAGEDWAGRVGVVPALLDELPIEPGRTAALLCGPEVMMRFTVRDLSARGVPDRHMHVSMERNMKCAVGLCGHCQFGAEFVCKDGAVFPFDRVRDRFWVREW